MKQPEQVEFKFVTADSLENLEKAINERMRQGWQVMPSPFTVVTNVRVSPITQRQEHVATFIQPMYLPHDQL